MRGAACSLAIILATVGCAQLYTPASANPAVVQMSFSGSFGVGDEINIVAIDGVSVDAAANASHQWRIDPGSRRLTLTYEASNKILGPRVAASPLVLNTKLEAGKHYQILCETSQAGVRAFVRRQSDNRIVSNVAESSLISAPATYPSPPPFFQIPAGRRR